MRLGRYRFAPPLWAWAAALAFIVLFSNLGLWQLRRADEKSAIIAAQREAAKAQPVDLAAWMMQGKDSAELYGRAVRLRGRLLANRQLLHDSQVHAGQAGYHVWTPLAVEDLPQLVLINRGWLAASPDRAVLPAVAASAASVELRGQWRGLPEPGLRSGSNDCERSSWPKLVQYPRLAELECLLERRVAVGIILLDPDQPDGYLRDWNSGAIPPERHIGYAFQWCALAGALLIVFMIVNLRKSDD
ncbi:MAG: SURF1 family protein [Nevskiales bacterium]